MNEMMDPRKMAETTVTKDAFHDGAFYVLQPKDKGNRSGMDALLLAAALPEETSGLLADLGSGAGVAGLAALVRNPALDLVLVENNPEMAELARQTRLLPENSHLRDRVRVLEADVMLTGANRSKAGLENDIVDHVIMNPPYNNSDKRKPDDALRAEAFMMAEGGLDAWYRTSAAILKPGGSMTIIHRTESLGEIIACSRGRFGKLEIIPIHSRAGELAKRMIVRGIRGSKAGLSIMPGFVVHKRDGSFTPEADAIFKGTGRLGN